MDMISAITVFTAVVEANSFSEAARRLGLSKSAVSKQVSRLEDRLGARLINRTTRRLSLTEVGYSFFERAQRIAQEVEDAEAAVTAHHTAPRGRLRVNAPVSLGFRWLAPILPDFLDRNPEITIDLVLNDRFIDVVEEGFDCAVRVSTMTDSSLIARQIGRARRIICASPEYLDRRGTPTTPAELARHEFVLYSNMPNPNELKLVDPDGHRHTIRVDGRLTLNNGDATRVAILNGLGVAPLPSFIVGHDLKEGRLIRLLPEFEDPFATIHVLYPHARHLSPKVRAFVDFLVERLTPDPPWELFCGEGC